MTLGPVEVDRNLLAAFAQLHDGAHHDPSELGCRIVQAETADGYPCAGEVLEVYARPVDPVWQRQMCETYGWEGPHDIVFFAANLPRSETNVVAYLRDRCMRVLVKTHEDYETARVLLRPLGIT